MKKSTLLIIGLVGILVGRQIYDRNVNIDPYGILNHKIVKDATLKNRFAAIDYIKVVPKIVFPTRSGDLITRLQNVTLDDAILKELERLAMCDNFVFLESDPCIVNNGVENNLDGGMAWTQTWIFL